MSVESDLLAAVRAAAAPTRIIDANQITTETGDYVGQIALLISGGNYYASYQWHGVGTGANRWARLSQ